MNGSSAAPFVVFDDDPTGVQTLAGVRVLLDRDPERPSSADRPFT